MLLCGIVLSFRGFFKWESQVGTCIEKLMGFGAGVATGPRGTSTSMMASAAPLRRLFETWKAGTAAQSVYMRFVESYRARQKLGIGVTVGWLWSFSSTQ